MARKGQFKKGGGRHGDGGKAIVRYRTNTITKWKTRSAPKKKGRRSRRGGDTVGKLLPIAVGAAALGYVADNVPEVTDAIKKIPGVKTVGIPLALGVGGLAVNRLVRRSRIARIVGIVGIAVGLYQFGQKKFDIEWLGDPDDGGPMD